MPKRIGRYAEKHLSTNSLKAEKASWKGMLLRVERQGIDMDPYWKTFHWFIKDMGRKRSGTKLCRYDSNKGFAVDNCFWGLRDGVVMDKRSTFDHLEADQEYRERVVIKEETDSSGVHRVWYDNGSFIATGPSRRCRGL